MGGPTSGVTVTGTTVIVQPPVIRLNVAPSAHGLVTIVKLGDPIISGQPVNFTATVHKVSGSPLIGTALSFGEQFGGMPANNFASLNVDLNRYSFADQQKNWFQLPDYFKVGDTFTVSGTVNVRDSEGTTGLYCLPAQVARLTSRLDGNGEPVWNWSDAARPLACGRLQYR